MIKALIFDWGDTIMRDFPELTGPMSEWEHVELIPGADQALASLNDKYICVIATSAEASDTGQMRQSLQRVDVEKYFHGFASSKELLASKPQPEYFLKIASRLGLKPQECIHIGNIYSKDISSAKAVGMKTVFFNEKKISGDFPDADAIIHHMSSLPETILTLSNQCQ